MEAAHDVRAEVTRPIFMNFTQGMEIAFYVTAVLALVVFACGVYLKVRKYRRGKPERRLDRLFWRRLGRSLAVLAANATVARRDRYAGWAHGLIMWGFIVLFIGTTIVAIDYDVMRPINPAWRFLKGTFYLGFSAALDILGAAFLVGLVLMMVRRRFFGLFQLDYRRVDVNPEQYSRRGYIRGDWLFVDLLFVIGVTGFLVEALRVAATDFPPFEVWSPVGWAVASAFAAAGMSRDAAVAWHPVLWWGHGILSLAFVAYLPYSKAVHMIVDALNLILKDPKAARRIPKPSPHASPGYLGYRVIRDLTWKQLVDLDACTKCGRCHAACPARAAGAPLSPRDVILDLRQHADASLAFLAPNAEMRRDLRYGGNGNRQLPIHVVRPETLWACTTCMACVEACPVGIEHLPLFVQFRRRLVDEGVIEPTLQEALTNLAKQGNSFGQSNRVRAKWTQGLPFKIKDARKEPVEYLWFVGDYASFDQRVQQATRSTARIFYHAGLDVGIMYEGEKSAGNDVRRVGEEGLFELLVEHNLGQMARCRFGEIVTTDPHTYNTLRHEYPEFGSPHVRISHYTELLVRLFDAGRLAVKRPLRLRATYHDPCYLGRYNGVYEAPRRLLRLMGLDLVEMPRNRANSFCCGAGGGRIWMDDSGLAERPSVNRIREAQALGDVQLFVVACPKDVTMYEAAVKQLGVEKAIRVKDISELLIEALGLDDAPAGALPAAPAGAV